ncbi:hypothetical protein PoB_002289700 [Plakobranchus ocellatus]|uniref:Uncharacterized protein n=1 Tax=Plakobranchus ocellatus TaxID=259542 RepID=A0AAV3ZMF7_9GAST|nr:hypothetical protein PoB_002289700 [Plakobranchus ocellatus]
METLQFRIAFWGEKPSLRRKSGRLIMLEIRSTCSESHLGPDERPLRNWKSDCELQLRMNETKPDSRRYLQSQQSSEELPVCRYLAGTGHKRSLKVF